MVKLMNNVELDHRIAQICALGCRRVSEIITSLEQGNTTDECSDLTPKQRLQILAELKAIMAVYEAR